jgi:iron complex outermembrane recepter protein
MQAPFQLNNPLLTLTGSAVLGLLISTAIHAEPSSKEALAIEEVIVTATKKSQALSETPAAISAVSGESIGTGGITDVASLQMDIPNLSVGNQFGVNRIFIRGIGLTSIDLGADGAVAFLQDGAIISRPAAQLAGFYDVNRVEVLRGPQGTLYGRGATAGVVNLVTNRPTEELEGFARLSVGNYSLKSFEGAVGGSLVDSVVMGRLALKIDRRDGYGENLATGNDVDDRDASGIRGSLVFNLSDDLELLLSAEYYQEDDNNYGFHYFGTTVVAEDQLPHNALGGRTLFDYNGPNADVRDLVSDEDAINDRDNTAVTAVLEWKPGDWQVTAVTAYRDFDRFNRDDLDVSDANVFGQNNYTEQSESFSEDITVAYTGERFDVLIGAMYFEEELFGEVLVPLVNFPLPDGSIIPNAGNYRQVGIVDTTAYGFFLQGTYEFTEKLSVTTGLRYNYEKRDGTGSFTFDLLALNIPTDSEKDWDALTPKLTVDYQHSDETLLYFTVARGFKSGVINIGSANPVIDPEFVWDYETGVKTQALDGSLSLNASAFYYDYSDLQVGFVNENSIVETRNAAQATNYGVELESQYQISENFKIDFFATYLNAEFDDFANGDYRQNFALVDLTGNRLPNAPEYSAKLGAQYYIALHDGASIVISGDYNWQDEVFFTEFNNDDAKQDSFGLLDLSATYYSVDESWFVSAWLKNLTDEETIVNNIITAQLYGNVRVGSTGAPRTFGLTLGFDF